MDHIYFKGLTEYLHGIHEVPKAISYDAASQADFQKLESFFSIDLTPYIPQIKIDVIKSELKIYPLRTTCFLLGIELSVKMTELVLSYYKTDRSDPRIIKEITENPYILLDIEGLSFQKVDKIATEIFSVSKDSPLRLKSLVRHSLNNFCNKNGHLFCPLHLFKTKIDVDIPKEDFKKYLKELLIEKKIVMDGQQRLYPSIFYKAECESSDIISNLIKGDNQSSFFKSITPEVFISGYEDLQTKNIMDGTWKNLKWTGDQFRLSEEQKEAIKKFLAERFFIITGLPGTGKTAVTKALVDISKSQGLEVCLMTPTGISSKRLATTCNHEANTIHKILGFDGVSWKRDENNRLAYDIIIVDEFSMVDQILLYRLLKALPLKEFVLVFIGDSAQLSSVGPGNVLKELISCSKISHVRLTKIFRQEDTSQIVLNAHLINKGSYHLVTGKDFIVYPLEDGEQILEGLIKIVKRLEREERGYKILSPTNKGLLGVTNLNRVLQDILNPDIYDSSLNSEHVSFRVKDRIMIIKNDYLNDVYNGEQGTLVEINKKAKKIIISINGKTVEYSFRDVYSYIALDYARTIHKSQGQEYDFVVMPYVIEFSIQLQRNLLYTAITRAKNKVFIIGHQTAIEKSVKNNNITKRNTLLAGRILQ